MANNLCRLIKFQTINATTCTRACIFFKQLTSISVEIAHSLGHVDDGSEWLGDVSIGQDDQPAGLVTSR